jgi:hypothetical protein
LQDLAAGRLLLEAGTCGGDNLRCRSPVQILLEIPKISKMLCENNFVVRMPVKPIPI